MLYSIFRIDSIYCLATNGEFEDVVISGGGDDVAYLWSLDDGMCAHKLEGHTDSVTACGFNCTGQLAATGALDGTVKVWDCATGELKATLDGPEDGIQVCFVELYLIVNFGFFFRKTKSLFRNIKVVGLASKVTTHTRI